jgi:hypothetical protein
VQDWVAFGAAAYDIGFGIFHLLFWRLFGWPDSLRPSGQVNMAITQTLNLMLSYGFFAFAVGLMVAATSDGQALPGLAAAGAGFWTIRAFLQPLLFGGRHPVSRWLTLLFLVGAMLHAAAIFHGAG